MKLLSINRSDSDQGEREDGDVVLLAVALGGLGDGLGKMNRGGDQGNTEQSR
jgi:hypothetical protein